MNDIPNELKFSSKLYIIGNKSKPILIISQMYAREIRNELFIL